MSLSFIVPKWPAPENVVAGTTTRRGGVSISAYKSFNLASHVNDNPEHVTQNREHLRTMLNLPTEPFWLEQVHGTDVAHLPEAQQRIADASCTETPNIICVTLTADCLPVLLCNQQGTEVAAIHAGWKGLAAGVIEATIDRMNSKPHTLMAWLGPAISQKNFEVGPEVLEIFINSHPEHQQAFIPSKTSGFYRCDLYLIARQKLKALGVTEVYGGEHCTYEEEDLFYSFRRDGITGRMASLIYLRP